MQLGRRCWSSRLWNHGAWKRESIIAHICEVSWEDLAAYGSTEGLSYVSGFAVLGGAPVKDGVIHKWRCQVRWTVHVRTVYPRSLSLPLCAEAAAPNPTCRQLLLDPGNGGDAVSKVMLLQVGKVAVLWRAALFVRDLSYWSLIFWTGLSGLYVFKRVERLAQKWVVSLRKMWSQEWRTRIWAGSPFSSAAAAWLWRS